MYTTPLSNQSICFPNYPITVLPWVLRSYGRLQRKREICWNSEELMSFVEKNRTINLHNVSNFKPCAGIQIVVTAISSVKQVLKVTGTTQIIIYITHLLRRWLSVWFCGKAFWFEEQEKMHNCHDEWNFFQFDFNWKEENKPSLTALWIIPIIFLISSSMINIYLQCWHNITFKFVSIVLNVDGRSSTANRTH